MICRKCARHGRSARWCRTKARRRRDARRFKLDLFEARCARALLERCAETRFRTRHDEGLFFRSEALALAAPAEVF